MWWFRQAQPPQGYELNKAVPELVEGTYVIENFVLLIHGRIRNFKDL